MLSKEQKEIMSNEWMEKVLTDLGFKEIESRVYLLLIDVGPKKAKDIANFLNLDISQLHRILKRLENTGLVNASPDCPAVFSAMFFDKVLELLVETRREQHKALLASKEKLLSTWRSLTEKDYEKS
jgi:sugar-specific transcriptional regulator TrmB